MKSKIGKILMVLMLLVIGKESYGITFTEDFSNNNKIDTTNTSAVVNTNLKRTTLSISSGEIIFEDIQPGLVNFSTDTVNVVGYNGSYWLIGGSTTGRINKYDGTTFIDLTSTIGFGADGVINTIEWNGSYWLIGGNTGGGSKLIKYDGTTVTDLSGSAQTALDFSGIRSMKWNGSYWLIGANAARIARYNGTTFTQLSGTSAGIVSGLTAPDHNVTTVGWNGSFWLTGASGGIGGRVHKYNGTTWTDVTTDYGSTADVYVTEWNGTYWLVGGGAPRLTRYDGTTFTNITSGLNGFGANYVRSASWNSDYNYWLVGGAFGGATILNRYDGTTFTNITSSLTNVSSNITQVLINWSGNNWFIYGPGSPRSFNKGFVPYTSTNIVQSKKLNDISENIAQATLTASVTLNGGSVSYELSADGGVHWETVTVGSSHTFKYSGKDLRYKATITSPTNRKLTPALTQVSINYKTESKKINAGEKGEVFSDDDAETKMSIPADSISKTLVYSIERKILPTKVEGVEVVKSYNFEAKEQDTNKTVQNLEGVIEIIIHYTSPDGVKIYNSDGKEIAKLAEAKQKLGIGFYNGKYWVPITSEVTVSSSDVFIRSRVSHLSEYGITLRQTQSIDVNVSPNPFTPKASQFNIVNFTFQNTDNESIELRIWDVTGRLVRTLNGNGTSSISWDGRDENGEYVEGGVYIYQLKVGNSRVKKGTIVVAY